MQYHDYYIKRHKWQCRRCLNIDIQWKLKETPEIRTPLAGGPYLRKGMMHTHQVGWLFQQVAKKVPKTRGFFFADKSLNFGSTSNRGCLISIINHSLCIVCKFASNSDTDLMSLLIRWQLTTVFGDQ